jgi:PAS domain S-box-containing protein
MSEVSSTRAKERAMEGHLHFLESLDRVNQAIQGTDDLNEMMNGVLVEVLSIFGCDRAWLVYPCDPEASSWQAAMERVRPQFPGVFALEVPQAMDPEVADIFRRARSPGGVVRFGPDADPVPANLAQRFQIQSVISMALYPKVCQPYMFGLHQCSHARAWSAEEERLFQEIGRRVTDALSMLSMFRSLRDSQEKLAEAQRITHVGYWDRDTSTDVITWSDETYRIFGLPPQSQIMTLSGLVERIHQDDRRIVAHAVAEAIRGGRGYDVEYRALRPGGELRFVHSIGEVFRDGAGHPRRMFGTVQDITERKAGERALQEAQGALAHVARVATLGEMTASIAHEVNQPLTAIVSDGSAALRWLAQDPPNLDKAVATLHRVIRDGKRAGEVIARIRELVTRTEGHTKVRLDINQVATDVLALIRSEIQKRAVKTQLHLEPELPPVLGDRVQLQQVLLNLIINAVEAMDSVDEQSRQLTVRSKQLDPDSIAVEVQDSGVGVDPGSVSKVFDAFFTTKPQGMGMGLAICRSIVEAHRGRLWVGSEPGVGTTFRFILPKHSWQRPEP